VAAPAFLGRRILTEFPLEQIVPYIDWTFFFTAWELRGRYPGILQHEKYGAAARDLFDAGRKLLDRIVKEKLITAQAVYGFWPAAAEGNDIILYTDEGRAKELMRFNMLRQQQERNDGGEADASGTAPGPRPLRSLADFVAPRASGLPDHLGAFAVTAGIGVDTLVKKHEAAHDDYSAIIVKAIADRFAEAFAEYLHSQARTDWGFGDALSNDELIDEQYRGIRPAFGYPACPDHSEKARLFDLLDARSQGLDLTESFAMTPAASVSGLYFSHPNSKYFAIQRVGQDQIDDYARRKGMSTAEVERWLRPVLAYEPALVTA
jgi:5-methyltetrahydrofolate--homocysteine methyltransferase